MAKYETLSTFPLSDNNTILRSTQLPEIVHLDDPAFAVMKDFRQQKPHTVTPDTSMDDALNEMKINGVHLLLVEGKNQHILGVIATEDVLGEKPIKIIQERRIPRHQILVKMIMTKISEVGAFTLNSIRYAKVGNIVNTLKETRLHYALVVDDGDGEEDVQHSLCGIFTTSQISRQLHTDIADSIAKAQTVSELQKRNIK